MFDRNALWQFARRNGLLVLLLLLLLIVRGIFLLSYPFFIEGDGHHYYHMLKDRRSSLIHASGFGFFLHPVRWLARPWELEPALILRVLFQLFPIVALGLLFASLRKLMHPILAFAACAGLGTDAMQVTAAGTTRPEHLQASCLVLLLAALIGAFVATEVKRKQLLYVGAGVLCMAAYLIKFNSLPCCILLLMILFDRGLAIRTRWWTLMKSCGAASCVFLLFLQGYHRPRAGTYALNLEHGWIHIMKLGHAQIPILPENGIATRKYLVLVHHLPPIGPTGDYWRSLNDVPVEIREPYRQRWSRLIESRDEDCCEEELSQVRDKLRAGGTYHEPSDFCRIYYFLGLFEAERLLAEVFQEALQRYPQRYLFAVALEFVWSGNFAKSYTTYLPVPGQDPNSRFFDDAAHHLTDKRDAVVEMVDFSSSGRARDFASHFWLPGACVQSWFVWFASLPWPLCWLLIGSGWVISLATLRGSVGSLELLHLLGSVTLLGNMAFSALVFEFRCKELILCQPLIFVLMASGGQLIWVRVNSFLQQSPALPSSSSEMQ